MYSTSIENLNTTINDESYDLMSIEPPPIEFSDDATDSNNWYMTKWRIKIDL